MVGFLFGLLGVYQSPVGELRHVMFWLLTDGPCFLTVSRSSGGPETRQRRFLHGRDSGGIGAIAVPWPSSTWIEMTNQVDLVIKKELRYDFIFASSQSYLPTMFLKNHWTSSLWQDEQLLRCRLTWSTLPRRSVALLHRRMPGACSSAQRRFVDFGWGDRYDMNKLLKNFKFEIRLAIDKVGSALLFVLPLQDSSLPVLWLLGQKTGPCRTEVYIYSFKTMRPWSLETMESGNIVKERKKHLETGEIVLRVVQV